MRHVKGFKFECSTKIAIATSDLSEGLLCLPSCSRSYESASDVKDIILFGNSGLTEFDCTGLASLFRVRTLIFGFLIYGVIAFRLMPQKLSNILSVEERMSKVLSQCDATDVLQDAFRETEAALEHEYEVLFFT